MRLLPKLILSGLAVLFLFIGLLFILSVYKPSKQVQSKTDQTIISSEAVERLTAAIRIRTITPAIPSQRDSNSFLQLHKHLDENFPLVKEHLRIEKIGLSLLYTWKGQQNGLKPILLMAHQDVVPVDDSLQWDFEPFGGKIHEGFIYGRGSLDIKSGVCGILEAVELLLKEGYKPKRTIYLAFGHDEESGNGTGASAIASILEERNVKLEYVLDEGGLILQNALPGLNEPLALIGIAEKGYMNIKMTAHEDGGHSSMPGKKTSVTKLSQAINTINLNPFPATIEGPVQKLFAYTAPEMNFPFNVLFNNTWLFSEVIKSQMGATPSGNASLRTTVAFTMLEGSSKENVLPEYASAIGNLRVMPGVSQADVIRYLIEIVHDSSIHFEVLSFQPASPVSSPDSISFRNLQLSIEAVFPETISAPFLLVALTDSKSFVNIADNIYRFHPAIYDRSDLKRLHGKNERIGVENYKKSIRFYRRLILNSDLK